LSSEVKVKLSAQSRYAIRALIDLSVNGEGNPVSIKEIAARQKISERYLENIFNKLKRSGILESTQGKGGGFVLAKNSGSVNLLEIIETLEGSFKIAECVDTHDCSASGECFTHELWRNLNSKVKESFEKITLKSISSK